jgi:hypothetical protein
VQFDIANFVGSSVEFSPRKEFVCDIMLNLLGSLERLMIFFDISGVTNDIFDAFRIPVRELVF